MKKISLIFLAVAFVVFSCAQNVNPDTTFQKTEKTGTIKGRAVYSNSNDSSGINIVLEKTDGIRSVAVMQGKTKSRSIAANTITQNDGSFILTDVPEGVYTLYAVSQNSSEKAVRTNVIVVDGETIELETFNLTVIGSISGKITLEDSETDSYGFTVYVASTSYSAMTDKDGSFKITGIPAGPGYSLIISRGSYLNYWKTDIEVPALDTISIEPVNLTREEIESVGQGTNGTSIIWKGTLSEPPENPEYLWAYFNTKNGCSYIYDGTQWSLLAAKGDKGNSASDTVDEGIYQLHLNFDTGASTTNKIPVSYTPGEPVELPNLHYEGKQFAGWFTDSDFAYQCEDIVYDNIRGRYVYTAPLDSEGLVELYAGSGIIIHSWDEYSTYIKENYNNGRYSILFFDGKIEATSSIINNIFQNSLKICGINNATLDLKENSSFGYTDSDIVICGLTIDGHGEYYFKIQEYSKTYDCVIKNCVFKNLNNTNCPWLISMQLKTPEGRRVIEDCKFIDCIFMNSAFSFSGGTTDSVITIKNCIFDNATSGAPNVVGIRNNSNAYLNLEDVKFNNCDFSTGMIYTKNLILAGKVYDTEIDFATYSTDKNFSIILDHIETGYGQAKIITPLTNEDIIETLYIKNSNNSPVTDQQMTALKMQYKNGLEIRDYPYIKQMLPIKVKIEPKTDFSRYTPIVDVVEKEEEIFTNSKYLDIVIPKKYKNVRFSFCCYGCDFLTYEQHCALYNISCSDEEYYDKNHFVLNYCIYDLPFYRGTVEEIIFAEDEDGNHYFLNYELVNDGSKYMTCERKLTMFDFMSCIDADTPYTITCKEITGIENDPAAEKFEFKEMKLEDIPYLKLTPGKQYEINASLNQNVLYGNNSHFLHLSGSKIITFDYENTIELYLE